MNKMKEQINEQESNHSKGLSSYEYELIRYTLLCVLAKQEISKYLIRDIELAKNKFEDIYNGVV